MFYHSPILLCGSFSLLRGFLNFLSQSRNMHVKLISECKLSVGGSVGEGACFPVCVAPVMDLSRMHPTSRPMTAGIGSGSLVTLKSTKRKKTNSKNIS